MAPNWLGWSISKNARLAALAFVSLVFIQTGIFAQPTSAVLNATTSDPVYVLRQDGTLTPLEERATKIVGEAKLFYLAGSKAAWVVAGQRSSVRLNADDAQRFITGPAGAQLVRFEIIHGRRECVTSDFRQITPFYASGRVGSQNIPVHVARTDANQYQVEPRSRLPPGEYGFLMAEPQPGPPRFIVYSFGINEAMGPVSATARVKPVDEHGYRCIVGWCRHH